MPCWRRKVIPPPPDNANVISLDKPSIDDHGKWISYNQMKPIIKAIKRNQVMYPCDIRPISKRLSSLENGKKIAERYNKLMACPKNKARENLVVTILR